MSFSLITIIFTALAVSAQSKAPKTARDYFMLLPGKYFSLDCCMMLRSVKAQKEKYLKTYLETEDIPNGYLAGGGDGAQEGFEMALFKRPAGDHLIGFYSYGEGGPEDTPLTVFLTYKSGRWTDVSKTVVPDYDPVNKVYLVPRNGTTVQVFEKDENGQDWYRGKKLYDLAWKNGKFSK